MLIKTWKCGNFKNQKLLATAGEKKKGRVMMVNKMVKNCSPIKKKKRIIFFLFIFLQCLFFCVLFTHFKNVILKTTIMKIKLIKNWNKNKEKKKFFFLLFFCTIIYNNSELKIDEKKIDLKTIEFFFCFVFFHHQERLSSMQHFSFLFLFFLLISTKKRC